MIVHYMCNYYPQFAHKNIAPRTQAQWEAFMFCRAVKYRLINGQARVPWKAGTEVITMSNISRAREIFGLFIDHTIQTMGISCPIIIPVPSKDGLLNVEHFRSSMMVCEALAQYANRDIQTPIRFNSPLQPASQGGPRGRFVLAPYLELVDNIPEGEIVLVDDLTTSGGSLLACYDKLKSINRVPTASIVCGYTVNDALSAPFGVYAKNIETSLTPTWGIS